MKNINRCLCFRLFFAAVSTLSISTSANAALVSRLNGQAVYDTDLNITWLADANYAYTSGYAFSTSGGMNWTQAKTWAAGLTVDGISGWRLPTYDESCSGYNCTGSEMGHLFYNELGGVAGQSISTTHNVNYNLFQNVQPNTYWTGTEIITNTNLAGDFFFNDGDQGTDWKYYFDYYAWAVRPGDVGAAVVPVPAAFWLFGSGLFGLFSTTRLCRSHMREKARNGNR